MIAKVFVEKSVFHGSQDSEAKLLFCKRHKSRAFRASFAKSVLFGFISYAITTYD